jgi:hypothetical protein
MSNRSKLVAIALASMACATPLFGQDSEGGAGLLSGPTVESPLTLVRYGLDGRLERLESRPELAAAEMLASRGGVDPSAAERVRAVARQRTDALRMLMVDELDAIATISELTVAGEEDAARDALRELWHRFDSEPRYAPMLEGLAQSLAETLGEADAQKLRSMVDAYWAALLAERMGERLQRRLGGQVGDQMADQMEEQADSPMDDRMAAGMPGARLDPGLVMGSDDPVIAATRDRIAFQMFQREVRYAYDQSLARYRELLESIDTSIEPTDAQRAAIRQIVLDHIKATRLEATPAQRREAMVAIYRELDDARRERLYALLLRQVVPD